MQCKKCGAEVNSESKFCGNCGALIEFELEQNNEVNNELDNNIEINDELSQNIQINENIGISDELVQNNQLVENSIDSLNEPIIQNTQIENNIPVDNSQTKETNKSKNKNNLLFIVLGVILAVLAAGLVYFSINKNSSNSIAALEKALGNFEKAGDSSGTVKLNVSVKSKSEDSINLSAIFMYAKNEDNYDLNLKINESMLTDEINLYSRINKENVSLYINSKILDMIGITSSKLDQYIKYNLDLSEFIDESEIKNDDLKLDIDLKKVVDSKHFKFVDRKNNNHYKLIIDKELLDKVKNSMELDKEQKEELEGMLESFGDLGNNSYEIDIYLNNKNELVKVEIDLSKYIGEDDIESALLSIEFSNLNNTVVEIPTSAINTKMDLETYISKYSNSDFSFGLGI